MTTLPLGCHSPEGRRKEASLWSSVLKHEEKRRVVCGKKSKAGLEQEETEDRIEDLLERLGLGIMVLTAYFASEKDEVGDNYPPSCVHTSFPGQVFQILLHHLLFCLWYWYWARLSMRHLQAQTGSNYALGITSLLQWSRETPAHLLSKLKSVWEGPRDVTQRRPKHRDPSLAAWAKSTIPIKGHELAQVKSAKEMPTSSNQ